jgi:histone-lysine N-methyltransferase SETD2
MEPSVAVVKKMGPAESLMMGEQAESKARHMSPRGATPKPADRASPALPSEAVVVKVTARKSKTAAVRDIVLYDDLPDMTGEAVKTFQVISDCLYGTKNIGATENDALDCDCRDEWGTSSFF